MQLRDGETQRRHLAVTGRQGGVLPRQRRRCGTQARPVQGSIGACRLVQAQAQRLRSRKGVRGIFLRRKIPLTPFLLHHGAGFGTGTRLRQRLLQGAIHEVVHQAAIAQAHFVLGRVHVHVHPQRIQFQEQHVGRLAAMEQHVLVGQLHRMGDAAVAYRAAVDVQVLLVGAGTRVVRLGDPALQAQAGTGVVHAQGGADEILTQGLAQAQARVLIATTGPVAARRLAVVADPQLHVRTGQRQRAQPFLDVAHLGALGTQELAPRRHVVEQVAHLHRGAGRMRLGQHLAHAAALDLQLAAMLGIGATRGQPETADRGDRGQGLATESQRGHRLQVVERGDLAGGMAADRQRQFGRIDATAVVADPDQAHPALLQFDVDPACTGIKRVLDQLLDHRCRAFDDFAGGDLVDQGVRKRSDRHRRMADGRDAQMIAVTRFTCRSRACPATATLRACRRRLPSPGCRPRRARRTGCPAAAGG